MDEKTAVGFAAKAIIPALVSAAAVWFTGIGGAQASALIIPALAAAYLAGYALLAYGEGTLAIPRSPGIYAFFILLAILGAAVGGGIVGASTGFLAASLAIPLAACFALPAVFEAGMELMKNVPAGRG